MDNLKRSHNNWITFLKATVILTASVIVILAFLALFLL